MPLERERGPALKGLLNPDIEFRFYSNCSRKLLEDYNGVWWCKLSFKKSDSGYVWRMDCRVEMRWWEVQ